MQLNYFVETEAPFTEKMFRKWGISRDDYMPFGQSSMVTDERTLAFLGFTPNANGTYNMVYHFPMTEEVLEQVKKSRLSRKWWLNLMYWLALCIIQWIMTMVGPGIIMDRFGYRSGERQLS